MSDLSPPLATLMAWADRMAEHDDDTAARPLWASIAGQVRDYAGEPVGQDESLFGGTDE